MSKEVKEKEKPYRGFTEDAKHYYIGNDNFEINTKVSGTILVEWKNELRQIVEKTPTEKLIIIQDRQEKLARTILGKALVDFDYDKMLEKCHPKELEGVAGNLYTFLYETGSEREQSLLIKSLVETKGNLAKTQSS